MEDNTKFYRVEVEGVGFVKPDIQSPKKIKAPKRLTALTLTGGTLNNLKEAKELRVWSQPKEGGDDSYFSFKPTLEGLAGAVYYGAKLSQSGEHTELPLAVVWDKLKKNWREVRIPKSWMRPITVSGYDENKRKLWSRIVG